MQMFSFNFHMNFLFCFLYPETQETLFLPYVCTWNKFGVFFVSFEDYHTVYSNHPPWCTGLMACLTMKKVSCVQPSWKEPYNLAQEKDCQGQIEYSVNTKQKSLFSFMKKE